MSRKWVINSSPLIFLNKVSCVHFLESLCEELIIPVGVSLEILRGPGHDPTKSWLDGKKEWIRDIGEIDPTIFAWDLGLGERDVLSWAYKNHGYEAIIDDLAARKCAFSLGIPVRGTLGVLLLAKREGLISVVKPMIMQLVEVGDHISPAVIKQALEIAGEE